MGLINNSFSAGGNFDKNWFSSSLYYTYMFGANETGHQLVAYAGGYWEKDTKSFIDGISFAPGFSAVFGTANIPFSRLPERQYYAGTGENWSAWKSRLLTRRAQLAGEQVQYTFGLMSLEAGLPLTFYHKNLEWAISYNYVIPVALPDEEPGDIKSQGYFGVSMAYTIQ